MSQSRHTSGHDRSRRVRAWLLYGALLAAACSGLAAHPDLDGPGAHPLALATLLVLSVGGYAVSSGLLARAGRIFDWNLALGLVSLAVAGPIGFLLVALAPDLVHLVRRGRAFAGLGLVANLVSWTAEAAVAGAVLRLGGAGAALPARGALLIAAGLVMLVLNFVCARLLLAVVRDGARARALVRDELLATLGLELLALMTGALCALMVPAIGVASFAAFAGLACLPRLVAARLLRAPSVAALTVDDAAAVYRDALADELGLSRADRRVAHTVDAVVQRRPLPATPAHAATVMQDALLVQTCTERPPTQPHFSATSRTQVVLVARRWAQLTARCTPALNHHEALVELHRAGLAHDAPLALAAAGRIIDREDALTEHVAGVPRLHRAPLPRALRHELLVDALGRLAA